MRIIGMGLALALCGLAGVGPARAADEVDLGFSQDGFATVGFPPSGSQPSDDRDDAVVSCSVPDGSLFVAGLASNGQRVATARFDERGALDTGFGPNSSGTNWFAVLGSLAANPVGTCLADGSVVLAYTVYHLGQVSLHLHRLSPVDGLPMTGFGDQGSLVIDLSDHDPLAQDTNPRAFNVGSNGDLLLSGHYYRGQPGDRTGFLLRLTAAGSVAAVGFNHGYDAALDAFIAAGPAGDGTIWAAAEYWTGQFTRTRVVRLNATTLAYVDTLHGEAGSNVSVQGGRMLDATRFALTGTASNLDAVLLVVSATGVQSLSLGKPAGAHGTFGGQVAPLANGDLFLAFASYDLADLRRGSWFARARFVAGQVELDGSFGHGGTLEVQAPWCPGPTRPYQTFRRYTFWQGRPTAAGSVTTDCAGEDTDFMVLRLDLGRMFRDGFD